MLIYKRIIFNASNVGSSDLQADTYIHEGTFIDPRTYLSGYFTKDVHNTLHSELRTWQIGKQLYDNAGG